MIVRRREQTSNPEGIAVLRVKKKPKEFDRFEKLPKALTSVPKSEIDEARADEKPD